LTPRSFPSGAPANPSPYCGRNRSRETVIEKSSILFATLLGA
jgi:hypothetical protein